MRNLMVFAGLWLVAATAHAQSDRGPYIGVGAGVFSYQEVDEDFGIVILEDTTSSYRLVAGFQLNEGMQIEASFGRTGDIGESYYLGDPTGWLDIAADYEVAAVRVLGLVPLGRVDFFGGVGYYEATIKGTVRTTESGLIDSLKDDDSGATLLGGIQFYVRKMTVRIEYEWLDTESDVTVSNFGATLLFHFGR